MTVIDDRKRGYALGATEYLIKPVNREKLYGILAAFLEPMPQPVVVTHSM